MGGYSRNLKEWKTDHYKRDEIITLDDGYGGSLLLF